MFCWLLFVLLSFFIWTLYCLSFDLRLLLASFGIFFDLFFYNIRPYCVTNAGVLIRGESRWPTGSDHLLLITNLSPHILVSGSIFNSNVLLLQRPLSYMTFQSFGFERSCLRLFMNHAHLIWYLRLSTYMTHICLWNYIMFVKMGFGYWCATTA
jgi:hypothetical protein